MTSMTITLPPQGVDETPAEARARRETELAMIQAFRAEHGITTRTAKRPTRRPLVTAEDLPMEDLDDTEVTLITTRHR